MPIKDSITIDEAIAVLKELFLADPVATQKLVQNRVRCNERLSNHPSIQVDTPPEDHGGYPGLEPCRVGILGVINGLFGMDEDGSGGIAATYSDEGVLQGFARLIRAEKMPAKVFPLPGRRRLPPGALGNLRHLSEEDEG